VGAARGGGAVPGVDGGRFAVAGGETVVGGAFGALNIPPEAVCFGVDGACIRGPEDGVIGAGLSL